MMSRAGRSYTFECRLQWDAGALAGLHAGSGGLELAPPNAAFRIAESEADALAASGDCGRLLWLRRESDELFALEREARDQVAVRQGRIASEGARQLLAGAGVIWIVGGDWARRYDARTLQRLGHVSLPGLFAAASDGCGGLWLLLRDANGPVVQWLDDSGCLREGPIELRNVSNPVAIACDPARCRLAILDVPEGNTYEPRKWHLHLVELRQDRASQALAFEQPPDDALPQMIAADHEGNFHLASSAGALSLVVISPQGLETSRQLLQLAPGTKPVGLLWSDGLILACSDGLYRIGTATDREGAGLFSTGTFLTPPLLSPPATPGGWNRAQIEVDLPRGASLRVTVLSTSDFSLKRDVEAKIAASLRQPALRLAALDKLLEDGRAHRVREQCFEGRGRQTLHVLLDRITDPLLWLKIEVSCPVGDDFARLGSLRVGYPDHSWLNDLPAIYREEPASGARLRQFLAPFEALYEGVDETIDGLAGLIDPATAPDERLPWLLGWLGFPPLAGLPPSILRKLLQSAGRLLERRGTLAALQEMLDIVTEGQASVEDSGAQPAFWVLSSRPDRHSPRLGRTTSVVARLPLGFRPGSMRLGQEPLPPICSDLSSIVRARCALVRIRVAIEPSSREWMVPIIESLLAIFVPAHCRVELQVAPAGRTQPGGRLDQGWLLPIGPGEEETSGARLADPNETELGWETRPSAWQLPQCGPGRLPLDGSAALDGDSRLE